MIPIKEGLRWIILYFWIIFVGGNFEIYTSDEVSFVRWTLERIVIINFGYEIQLNASV